MQLDIETVLAAEEINVGMDRVKIVESPGKMIIYDLGTNDGISITGKFDNNLLKKDIQEYFSDFLNIVRTEDIRNYTWYEWRSERNSIDRIEEFTLPYESWNKIIVEEQKDEDREVRDSYLKNIKIENFEDFKHQMKALPKMFPCDFDKDSLRTARILLDKGNLDKKVKEEIGRVLTELGCSDPEKTKERLDRWAGFAPAQKVEKNVCEVMER